MQENLGRKSVKEWIRLAKLGELEFPEPKTYHRDFTEEYLSESFQGEALPGVFLPCSSNWSFVEATRMFTSMKGREPITLMELNKFVEFKFPIEELEWNPQVHISHISPYHLSLYPSLNLPMRAPGCDEDHNSRLLPYSPYNWQLARQRVNMHDILAPLWPYLADPLLTTLALSKDIGDCFLGLSLEAPGKNRRFVCRVRPFYQNQLSYVVKVGNNTKIGRCAYCNGLYLLPCAYVVLCYFVPHKLEIITHDIVKAWQSSNISVCAIHFLHKSSRPSNGLLNVLKPAF